QLSIASAPRSGAVVARLSEAVVHRGDFTLGPLDVEIGWAERVAILGPNGSGKTTLLNALLGRLPLAEGRQWIGPGVVVGEIDQARASLATDDCSKPSASIAPSPWAGIVRPAAAQHLDEEPHPVDHRPMNPEERRALIDRYRDGIEEVDKAIAGATSDDLDRRPDENAWSA